MRGLNDGLGSLRSPPPRGSAGSAPERPSAPPAGCAPACVADAFMTARLAPLRSGVTVFEVKQFVNSSERRAGCGPGRALGPYAGSSMTRRASLPLAELID